MISSAPCTELRALTTQVQGSGKAILLMLLVIYSNSGKAYLNVNGITLHSFLNCQSLQKS